LVRGSVHDCSFLALLLKENFLMMQVNALIHSSEENILLKYLKKIKILKII